jgi:3-deoxy-manno-octulosonate cytidylyltransferase (CMP-KDO synthetase)
MTTAIMIPARMKSTRLPGKMLKKIEGVSLISRVYNSAKRAKLAKGVFIVTDSNEIAKEAEAINAPYFMTDPALPSGTARIASVIDYVDANFILNVQGDMPFIQPSLIDSVISKITEGQYDIVTPIYPISDIYDISEAAIAKVVIANNGQALYFSRSPIPFVRDVSPKEWLNHTQFWGHVGIYAFRRKILSDIKNGVIKVSELEASEKLEQLSFLAAGYTIQTVKTKNAEQSVDTYEDLEKIRSILKK